MGATAKDYAQRQLGGGKLYIAEYTGDVLGSEEWFGITENLVQTVSQDFITIENTEGENTVDDLKVVSKTTVELKWDTKNVSPVNLARAFLGDVSKTTVVAGSATSEVSPAVTLDTAFPLHYKYASNIVVKDDTDATTYTLGTDYTVDTTVQPNRITPITGGAISNSDILHTTYDYAGYTDGLIHAIENAMATVKLRFEMANGQGYDYTLTYHKANISAGGDFSLKATDDAGSLSFTATVIQKTGTTGLFDISYSELT